MGRATQESALILVDSSIGIETLRPKGLVLRRRVETLAVVFPGVVRSEMLKGARNPLERNKTKAFLDIHPTIEFREEHWIALGDNLAALQRKELSIPFPDVILATLALAYDVEVWARDKHFPMMLPALRLFDEAA